jgi:hypothetical protein
MGKLSMSKKAVEQSSECLPRDDWATKRAPPKLEDGMLSLEAVAWLDSLPQIVRPHQLARRYPRICNRLVERWNFRELIIPYFDNLLLDSGGGRQGFPLEMAIEIINLKEYFLERLTTSKLDARDGSIGRR